MKHDLGLLGKTVALMLFVGSIIWAWEAHNVAAVRDTVTVTTADRITVIAGAEQTTYGEDSEKEKQQVIVVGSAAPRIGFINKAEDVSKLEITEEPTPGKTVYLTFDDGPGKYTGQLLDILAEYGAKATFFTTSTYPDSQLLIRREAEEGHTVAVHSFSHKYSQIYASADAFWQDYGQQSEAIEFATGAKPRFLRFPGGSSNTVSANYCKGIMTELADEAGAAGLRYVDWNVYSGDAGETTDADTIAQNVIDGILRNTKNDNPSVVLQHDTKNFSVQAVEKILQWGVENGYTFLPLTTESPVCHHQIAN